MVLEKKEAQQTILPELIQDEMVDDPPVRGTRLLTDIYQRCSVAILVRATFSEAENDPK